MSRMWVAAVFVFFNALAVHAPAQAQGAPEVTPSLKKMLGALPIAGIKDELQGMVGALRKTGCGGNLTGCYTTQSGPLHLYFFTSGQAQQTFLLVVDKKFPLPRLLGNNVQRVMGDTSLSSPIISISTTDYDLDIAQMPTSLQKVVRESYFDVASLSFSSGVQLAARASLGGAIKTTMEALGVRADQLTMRAAVVLPIPTDLASGAGTAAGMADAVKHGETMKKAGADALSPEAFVEFQFAPNARLPLALPPLATLTDATFFINNALTFGYKGNASFQGVGDKKIIIHFQTPLTPAGVLDLADFQFLMATPSNFTMEDAAHVMVAMATPDPRLTKYGGGFIRNIESFKKPLLAATKPLSVFKLKNPEPHAEYRFGDRTKPFPNNVKYFNMAVLGPLAQDGPLMKASGEVTVLGQTMGSLDASAGRSGLHGKVVQDLSLKLGPLGKVTISKMVAETDIDKDTQRIRLKGSYYGQVVEVILSGATLTIDVPANCVNPFEIKASLAIEANANIADVFNAQGGANVDPTKIAGCIGKELEAALNKIAGEYKSLSGYTAGEANQALKKISDDAAAAAAQAAKAAKAAEEAAAQAADAARKEYEKTKNAARDTATKVSNDATRVFNDAGNAFKGIGKKKKHSAKPDARFDRSVFNWDFYYDNHSDLRRAGVDLVTHWKDHGFQEGRQASLEFSAKWYLNHYPDLQRNLGDYDGVLWHWVNYGPQGCRQASPDFSVRAYLNRYTDLQRAFGKDNCEAAFDHWMDIGKHEGRNGRP